MRRQFQPTRISPAAAVFNRPQHDATGLYYYRARFYDPALGRFVSQDPISFAAGDGNLYRYVGNSSLIATDPFGMNAFTEGVVTVGKSALRGAIWGGAIGGIFGMVCGALDAASDPQASRGDVMKAALNGASQGILYGAGFGALLGAGNAIAFGGMGLSATAGSGGLALAGSGGVAGAFAKVTAVLVVAGQAGLAAYTIHQGAKGMDEAVNEWQYAARYGCAWAAATLALVGATYSLNAAISPTGSGPSSAIPIAARLRAYFEQLARQPRSQTAEGALGRIGDTLGKVEDSLSGIPKQEPPPPRNMPDGRMYPPQEDSIVRNADGSISAKTRGHDIEIGKDGSIRMTNRRTGEVDFEQPGAGE